uniref:Uncharacterized protein n=1 Tax=Solanum tuberosum TaxID=4113 RepID=M1BT99_SOLTU
MVAVHKFQHEGCAGAIFTSLTKLHSIPVLLSHSNSFYCHLHIKEMQINVMYQLMRNLFPFLIN